MLISLKLTENTAGRQSRQVETCCKTVLQKQLQLDPSPAWGKLDDVNVSFTTNPLQSTGYKGTLYWDIRNIRKYTHYYYYIESDHLKIYHNATRFAPEKECWPLEKRFYSSYIYAYTSRGMTIEEGDRSYSWC